MNAVADLDVHKRTVVACVMSPEGQQVRTSGTMTRDLRALTEWLRSVDVSHVAMESTGVFWQPIYNVLEDAGLDVLVANARQAPVLRSALRTETDHLHQRCASHRRSTRTRQTCRSSSQLPLRPAGERLLVNPTITFLATNKVIGNLLGRFPAWNLNLKPLVIFVIDQNMRIGAFNPRIYFESHSIAGGCVTNLFRHLALCGRHNPVA